MVAYLIEGVTAVFVSVLIGIAWMTVAILLTAGALVASKHVFMAAMEHKVRQKDRAAIQVLQQRAIETQRRTELTAGTRRLQATIHEVVVLPKEK